MPCRRKGRSLVFMRMILARMHAGLWLILAGVFIMLLATVAMVVKLLVQLDWLVLAAVLGAGLLAVVAGLVVGAARRKKTAGQEMPYC